MIDPQLDFKAILKKLYHNLNILLKREARHAGNALIKLPQSVEDHHHAAIDQIQQAAAVSLSVAEWREAMQPLPVDIHQRSDRNPQ